MATLQEMIEHLREVVVNILHTKEGAKVTLNCLWHGTAKVSVCAHMHACVYGYCDIQDRKLIVKSFKTFVRKICVEENGHMVMLGLFDCVDDTVLVKKALLSVSAPHTITQSHPHASHSHRRWCPLWKKSAMTNMVVMLFFTSFLHVPLDTLVPSMLTF